MTSAERQAKQRERNKSRQDLLLSLALVVTRAGQELEDSNELKANTAASIKRLARKIRTYDGTLNPEV